MTGKSLGDPKARYFSKKGSKAKKRPRCHNCKYAGEPFKLGSGTMTHMHCEHPIWLERHEAGEAISAWDTLQEFWQTCNKHEFKQCS